MVGSSKHDSLVELLDNARRRLVETGTRNRLVHVNRANRRANALNIVNERADDVFDILRTKRRKMHFKATASDDPDIEDPILIAPPDDPGSERFTDRYLETPLGPEGLAKRLMRLSRDARTAEEEQGVNILYLALGFLKWYEDEKSSVPREAPLVLLPVELVRNNRTGSYDLRTRDDELGTNLPLQERLHEDFGLTLPDIDEAVEGWSPSVYFDDVDETITSRARWEIDRDGMQLGFFSFSKLLMLRDLNPENWPDGALVNNMMRQLLAGGFEPEPPLFPADDNLDRHLDPAELVHIVDADASQAKVIEEVRAGRNLVVQGPPGTGKSQTIANMIASAVHDGKTVLFVAEKMAALNVVHSRLVKTDLRDICIELHSRKANKKAFLQELKRTLTASREAPEPPPPPDELRAARDQLNQIADLMHTPLPDHDYTPFDALSEVVGFYAREVSPPQLQAKNLSELDNTTRDRLSDLVAEHVRNWQVVGSPDTHPFNGVTVLDLQPTDLQRLDRELAEAEARLTELLDTAGELAERLAVTSPKTRTRLSVLLGRLDDYPLKEMLKAGAAWLAMRDTCMSRCTDAAWAADVERLRPAISRGVGSILVRLFGGYRSASRELAEILRVELPHRPTERLALVDELIAGARKHAALAEDENHSAETLAPVWRGERTWLATIVELGLANSSDEPLRWRDKVTDPADEAESLAKVIDGARNATTSPLHRLGFVTEKDDPLAEWSLVDLRDRLKRMHASLHRYDEWRRFAITRDRLNEAGLDGLLELMEDGTVSLDNAVDELNYAIAEARWAAARMAVPKPHIPYLDELSHLDRHRLVETFRDLDKGRMDDTAKLVRGSHLRRLPQGAAGEMGFLRGEIAKKRGHRSIRKIMEAAGNMVQRIKPVFLMSPMSIAQFLPPGKVTFDVMVIDEASQVRPEDALGAIARTKQIVVVGDQKQLPPTRFFDRLVGNDDETVDAGEDGEDIPTIHAGEMESVLTLCEARGLRQAMLEWHYRSRDPSLIAVSNDEFYDNRLILPPSPVQHEEYFGLKFTRVSGVYSSKSRGEGRPGTNRIEAEAVASAVARHARECPDFSLGVTAFSKAQSDMVNQLLEHARRKDPTLDAFLRRDKNEEVFVKNLEHVQGDERDVILISVGYGPHEPDGRLASMNFGPVNTDGGERRLNVLFTRARARCEVFCSFEPSDIDLSRISRAGPRVLKRFLEYAKTGELAQKIITGEGADSPFERDVAEVIRSLGYEVDPQVGTAGFRIDLGVRNPDRPGQYIMAVECDGATYHAALWARERDRQRQDILEGFGWRFHRIWSTDWFHRRTQEIERLRDALVGAWETASAGLTLQGANASTGDGNGTDEEIGHNDLPELGRPESDAPELSNLTAQPYRKADFHVSASISPHEIPINQLAEYVVKVVETEGPVHADEVARRIASIFDKGRAGRRIREVTRAALAHARRHDQVQNEGEFWFTATQAANTPVRDRSDEEPPTTKADYLPPMEIRAAAEWIRQESGTVEDNELVQSIARLLGFRRVGQDLRGRISSFIATSDRDVASKR